MKLGGTAEGLPFVPTDWGGGLFCGLDKEGVMLKKLCLLLAALLVICAGIGWGIVRVRTAAEIPMPVLMYHHIVPDGEDCNEMSITAGRLEEDLQWLADNGYTTVLPRELAAGKVPEKPVLITFDDGYRSNYELAYPLLLKHQAKAVISIMTLMQDCWSDEFVSWIMCQEMHASGLVEIGSHAYALHNLDERAGRFIPGEPNGVERLPGESDAEFQTRVLDDIQKSFDLIAENVAPPTFFAYPFGRNDPDADALIQELFPVTASTHPRTADLAGGLRDLPRYSVTMKDSAARLLDPPLLTRLKNGVKVLLGRES